MFRVMGRDDIVELHFQDLKNPIGNANAVLKRLVRDKHIEVSTQYSPYLYFPILNHIKKDSAKIPHFLKLVQVYKDLCLIEKPSEFIVEPKYQKGLAEPDIYTVFRGTPLFIEVQTTLYSNTQMDDKIKKYELLKESGLIPAPFPHIILITNNRYAINTDELKLTQTTSITQLMNSKPVPNQPSYKIKLR